MIQLGGCSLKKLRKFQAATYSVITLAFLYHIFANSINLNPFYADSAFFWCVVISVYLLVWSFFRLGGSLRGLLSADEAGRIQVNLQGFSFGMIPRLVKILLAAPWVLFVVAMIFSTVLFNWKAYRDQLGEPQVQSFSSDMQVLDISQVPIVDKALASKLADKKLGERPSLGSQVVLGEPTIQRVDGKLVWAVPLHHSGFFKWLTNLSGTPGYVVVSATNMNDVEYVDSHLIKYQPNSYLLHDLTRYTRFTSALFTGITDYSFELDDSGVPHWIVTTYKNLRGFALPEADGVIIVNATTGETKKYALDNVPEWVDRVQPEDFIISQIRNKGEYVHGFLNFSDKDKYRPSQGEAIIYNNGRCYLFTGLTSVGNDESAIGFMMVDMVTKEPLLYQMNGATEAAAQASAQGKVQHLGYYASFPIILNVDGTPSYFMTLKDREGLIKQYALVSVESYSIVGVGDTMEDAFQNYQSALRQSGVSSDVIQTGGEEKTSSGTVLRIKGQFDGNETVYFLILEEMQNKIFTVTSSVSDEIVLTQPGDRISVRYYEAEGQPVLSALEFDNLMFSQS